MIYVVYKIINTRTKHFYIGRAKNEKQRKRAHWHMLRNNSHGNPHLTAAWKIDGEQAFIFKVVERYETLEECQAAEQVWLDAHWGKKYFYNCSKDAIHPLPTDLAGEKNPMFGKTFSHTPEAKEKIRITSTGRLHTEEAKQKITDALTGHTFSEETRKKISDTLSGEGNFWFGKKRPASFAEKVRKPIIGTDANGVEHHYDSIKQAREVLRQAPTFFSRALKHGRPIQTGPLASWVFRYRK